MSRSEHITRVVAAALATLLACMFVLGYHSIKHHNHVEHDQLDLPMGTHWVGVAFPWAFVVPFVVLALGLAFLKLRVRRDLSVIILANIAWLFALAWPLLCLYAWELPFILLAREGS